MIIMVICGIILEFIGIKRFSGLIILKNGYTLAEEQNK